MYVQYCYAWNVLAKNEVFDVNKAFAALPK